MSNTKVFVDIAGAAVPAGTVHSHRHRGVESANFTYSPTYLGHPNAYQLDPGFPRAGGAIWTSTDRAQFGVFTDCAPGRFLRPSRSDKSTRARGGCLSPDERATTA